MTESGRRPPCLGAWQKASVKDYVVFAHDTLAHCSAPLQIRAHLLDVKQIIGLPAKLLGRVSNAHFMALALKFN